MNNLDNFYTDIFDEVLVEGVDYNADTFYDNIFERVLYEDGDSIPDDLEFEEAYYGRLPEFEEIAKLFDAVAARAKKEGLKCNPNKYPEMPKITTLFKNVFGLAKCIFYWYPSDAENAMTINVEGFMCTNEIRTAIMIDKKRGYYDKSHKNVIVLYAFTGLFRCGLTGAELTAIFLHEFGHNFDVSRFRGYQYLIDTLMYEMNFSGSIEDHNKLKEGHAKAMQQQGDAIYANPQAREQEAEELKFRTQQYADQTTFRRIITWLQMGSIRMMDSTFAGIQQLITLGDKKSEQFADSFATAYGFGPDLASGIQKLGKLENRGIVRAHNGFINRVLRHMEEANSEILDGMLDVHGTDPERIKDSIRKLNKDRRHQDCVPELRKQLDADIEKLTQQYKQVLRMDPKDKNFALMIWRRFYGVWTGQRPNFWARITRKNYA